MFDYQVYAKNGSMYNTPPTYAIYLAGACIPELKGEWGSRGGGREKQKKSGAAL